MDLLYLGALGYKVTALVYKVVSIIKKKEKLMA